MELYRVVDKINFQFHTRSNGFYAEQSGVTYDAGVEVHRIGYATNLTLEVIESARRANINLIVTHHDAWTFIGDLNERCMKLLREYGISHYFNHLPLDDAEFGTNASLAKALGLKVLKRVNDEDGFKCGLVGEFDTSVDFRKFKELCEDIMGESVQSWRFNDRPIKRVHILCGAGHLTTDMQVSIEEDCDVYLTGEKILYTVEFAKLNALNLIVGSHTFTELLGVKSMLEQSGLDELEIVKINEDHMEAAGFSR